jgi:class 3 adenylate cyclase
LRPYGPRNQRRRLARSCRAPQAVELEAEAFLAAMKELKLPDGRDRLVRHGIASGLVVVGDLIGEGASQEQAVVGDTPNLAARLQGLAEPGTIVVGASTRGLLGDVFRLRNLGRRHVKGLAESVEGTGPGCTDTGCISRQWASGFLVAYRSFFCPGGPQHRRWS